MQSLQIIRATAKNGNEGERSMAELKKATNLDDLLNSCPKNQIIANSLIRTWKEVNDINHKKIVCSISGGR